MKMTASPSPGIWIARAHLASWLLLAVYLLPAPSARAADPLVYADSRGTMTFETRSAAGGAVTPVVSGTREIQFPFTLSVPPGQDMAGSATMQAGWPPSTRLGWTDMMLSGPATPGRVSALTSNGLAAYQRFEDDSVREPISIGLWAAVHGWLDRPAAGNEPPLARLRLSGQQMMADYDFNSYEYTLEPVEIECRFGAGSDSVNATTFQSLRYLNAEKTEFEAFALSRFDTVLPGVVGVLAVSDLEVVASPGVRLELTGWTPNVLLPEYGSYATAGAGAIPEPGTVLLISGGLALTALRRRFRR